MLWRVGRVTLTHSNSQIFQKIVYDLFKLCGIFDDDFVTNLLLSLTLKSFENQSDFRSYAHESWHLFSLAVTDGRIFVVAPGRNICCSTCCTQFLMDVQSDIARMHYIYEITRMRG